MTEDARERMQRSPNKSVSKLAVEIGVSYGSAHKILRKELGMYPYKVSVVQELKPPDIIARFQYIGSNNNDKRVLEPDLLYRRSIVSAIWVCKQSKFSNVE